MEKAAIQPTRASEKTRRTLACLLLFFLFSFLGWAWEKLYFLAMYGALVDRGFLTLPLCTVYGSALILIRLVLGLPETDAPYPANGLRLLFYAALSALIASAVELCTGLLFEEVFGVRLWTYYGYAHTVHDYICLSVSVAWGAAIAVAMWGVWAPLERRLMRVPFPLLAWGSSLLTLAVALDFLLTAFLL